MKLFVIYRGHFFLGMLIGTCILGLYTYFFPAKIASQNGVVKGAEIIKPNVIVSSPIPTFTPVPTPTDTPTPRPTPTSIPTPTPTPQPITSGELDAWFEKYSHLYSVDRSLLFKIAVCESGLKPNAVNGIYGGLYQFSAATWRSTRSSMNLDDNPDLRFNPEEAIKTAAFKVSTAGASAWPHCQ